jgi:AraC family transcriptional regulator
VGEHAFPSKPGYQQMVESVPTIHLVRDVGLSGNWNMPVALWHSSNGYGEESDLPSLPNSCIAIALSGTVECVKGGAPGRRGDSRPDLITLFRTGDPCLYVARGELRCAHLNFGDALWRELASQVLGRPADSAELVGDRVFKRDRHTRAMVDVYLTRALGREIPSALEMDSRANLIALALVHSHSSLSSRTEARPIVLAPLRLARVKEYLDTHLAGELRLAEIAAVAELSPFHFARAFKHEVGVPPHQYLMQRRVHRARELLAGTQKSLAEIALACGFAGQSHFTTAFKRHTGIPPGAWRASVCT